MSKKISVIILIKCSIVCLFLCSVNAYSQKNIVKIGKNNLETNSLKEGTNKYLVYRENAEGVAMDISIWERTVSFSKLNNEDVIIIKQNWKNQDPKKSRTIYSINNKKDFYPIYHYAVNGSGIKDAFDFNSKLIKGTDSISQNSKKDFYLALETPTYNWELDMETFQCLPFEKDKIFRINFYHPGSRTKPSFYDYKVIGEELLDIEGSNQIDCWLLKIEYEGENNAVFWINKESREVLKMMEQWNGIKRYKIKFRN